MPRWWQRIETRITAAILAGAMLFLGTGMVLAASLRSREKAAPKETPILAPTPAPAALHRPVGGRNVLLFSPDIDPGSPGAHELVAWVARTIHNVPAELPADVGARMEAFLAGLEGSDDRPDAQG